jgi:6-pyruvoyltetrahydropterin/6-carboxytetrahydropterin synthase
VEVDLEADTLDERGMVVDFDDVKRALQGWIDEHLDHRMILSREDGLTAALEAMGEPTFVLDANPTAEAIARLLWEQARRLGLPVCEVRVWETDTAFASYRADV